MVVHKRIAKAIKKKREVKHDLPPLSDIPAFFPYPGVGALALRNPGLATAVGTYMLMEATQPYWGPPVEAHGQRTREQYEAFIDQFINPRGQVGPSTYLRPGMPDFRKTPRATTLAKRKVSKANKAMKKAYAWLIKGHKGKLSQKKCRELLKKASKMASKANPGTKSKIGKGRTRMLKQCRQIRKTIWGTLKRK